MSKFYGVNRSGNRHSNNSGKPLYRLPVLIKRGRRKQERRHRRGQWLVTITRSHMAELKAQYLRMFSDHFVHGEVFKLQQHMSLLRDEYVRLQDRYNKLEQQYAIATAAAGDKGDESFLARLLCFVADLYDKEVYSDMTVRLKERQIRVHRFVLAARSDHWGVDSLATADTLDWSNLEQEVGETLLKWVYTDRISLPNDDDTFTLGLLRAAAGFKLQALMKRCEKSLMGTVTVRSCVKLYTTADEIGAETLRDHCSTLIATHWNDFTPEDFEHMTAPLLYAMFKTKTDHPLHSAVRLHREDVVFLFLMEFDAQLPGILNEVDDRGDLALDLALRTEQEGMAQTLVDHGANVDNTDCQGRSLLHKAVLRGDEFAARFLISVGASVNVVTPEELSTPLHLICQQDFSDDNAVRAMARIAEQLLDSGANPNIQDVQQRNVMHLAVMKNREELFHLLVECPDLNLELQDSEGFPVLWYALLGSNEFADTSYAATLIQAGASPDAVVGSNNSLLHLVAAEGLEEAGLFLTTQDVKTDTVNLDGETPLHVACTKGLASLTTALLQMGATPNLQTFPSSPTRRNKIKKKSENPFSDENGELPEEEEEEFEEEEEHSPHNSHNVFRETPLHRAIRNEHEDVIRAVLDYKYYCETSKKSSLIVPDLNLRDSLDLTPLGVAIHKGLTTVAKHLLEAGSDINTTNAKGLTLLHRAILAQDKNSSSFLITSGADVNIRTPDGKSPLELCIDKQLGDVVTLLCTKGADMSPAPGTSDPPLWCALNDGLEDIASTLVKHKVDTDAWGPGPDGCLQTLLHRAIDENREDIACFLVRSGCDVNSVRRRMGPSGASGDAAKDLLTPLHLCCSWGLQATANTLLEHQAKVNSKDADGKTPLHHAIENVHHEIITLLLMHPSIDLSLRDKSGITAFAAAMSHKNNKAAQAILDREPKAAEQYDHKGHNFLHVAIQKKDMESVLFLLSIHVDMHTRTQDEHSLTPLHLATLAGSDLIVRNLLLAGAAINERTPQKQTVLHLAAANDHPHLASIFLENGIDFDAVDDNLNNALHVAIKEGHLSVVKVLLTESRINAGAVNLRGQNPLHVLAKFPKDNAAAIGELFLQTMPDYPLDQADVDGNTALILAYMRGAGQLCRLLVKAGACLGMTNKHGVNIFNYQVATKTLLYRLLDYLSLEPPWSEGELCMECGAKFGLATRKHHCRHCGRLLCNKCSDKDVPILKFSLNKPVRVCQICFEVLTLGPAAVS